MKYYRDDVSRDAIGACNGSRRDWDRLGVFAFGISEEIAKKLMSQHNLNDDFILDELRSLSLEHFSANFRDKFDHNDTGCAASYIIGMLRNRMIDYLRSLNRADKMGELNKSYAMAPDEHGVVKKRLVQSVKDDFISEKISDGEFGNSEYPNVNDLDFNDDYIYKR